MSSIRDQLGSPWSPSLDAYNYLCGLTKPDWAWECLRRNLDYQAQVQSASFETTLSVTASKPALSSPACQRGQFGRKLGNSAPFADPSLTAPESNHLWLPSSLGVALTAVAGAIPDQMPGGSGVFIPALPALKHILIDAGGRQHLLLRANGAVLQLVVEGADVATAPVTITFLVRGLNAIGRASDQLDLLRRILSPTRSRSLPPWTPRTQNLRDALITLDGRRAGASYREIATIIHGAKSVAEDWHKGLRERMRRHYKRGFELSVSGYRDFLR